jgi:muramidase (phage lysozyme)
MTTETQTSSNAEVTGTTPTTAINFLGLDGMPIANLDVLIKVGDREYKKSTDADGKLPLIQSEAGTLIEISVKRMDDSYKAIDSCSTSSADACWTYTSPALVLEAITQLHAGEPGDVETQIPRYAPEDAGVVSTESLAEPAASEPAVSPSYRNEGSNHPRPSMSASTSAASKPISDKLPDPKRAAAPKTGASAPIATGRNSKGEPVAVYTEKSRDWWGRWLMSTLHFFGVGAANASQDTQPSSAAKSPPAGSTSGKQGASKAAPPAAASSSIATFDTSVAYSGSMTDQVKKLIEIASEQTGYEIAGGTQNYLSKEKNGTKKLQEYPEKGRDKSKGFCYAYVKIALMRANIIHTAPGNEAASEAGPELLSRGFTDVTDSVPDPRWAAPGDVIVYAWTPKTLENERRLEAFGRKVKEYKAQGKKIDFELADVSASESNKPNFGHIDIRSYDGYISDHIPPKSDRDPSPGEPRWTRYNTKIRIYRKVFDPMPTLRIAAFLRCLREYECTTERDDAKRFNMLNAALPSNPNSRRFDSYQSHPWQGNGDPAKGSTAAGAYQILYKTWKEKFDKGLVDVPAGMDRFSPELQHRIAVMKLYDRNALNHIRLGEIEKAITGTTLPSEWSSLPGGKENVKRLSVDGKPMDMAYFLHLFSQYLEEEKRKANLK